MPRLSQFYGIVVYIYFREHFPPHFHAKYNEFEAQIGIDDLRILNGFLPPKALALIVEWASLHKSELKDRWEKIQRGEQWTPIPPLA